MVDMRKVRQAFFDEGHDGPQFSRAECVDMLDAAVRSIEEDSTNGYNPTPPPPSKATDIRNQVFMHGYPIDLMSDLALVEIAAQLAEANQSLKIIADSLYAEGMAKYGQ